MNNLYGKLIVKLAFAVKAEQTLRKKLQSSARTIFKEGKVHWKNKTLH